MSAGLASDSPVQNRDKNSIKGRLKFELVGKSSKCQHVTYSPNLVRLISQSTNIDVSTYQRHFLNNSRSQHKTNKISFALIGYIRRLKYPNLKRPDV